MEFCIECRNGWRARVAWVIESVASSSETDAVRFGFLRSNTTNEVSVGHLSIFWNVCFGDGEHGAGAGDAFIERASFSNTMWEESTKFVGCAASPDC